MPEEEKKEVEKKEVTGPSSGTIGEAGGAQMPRVAEGLVYNPETISLSTFIEMEDDAQIKAVITIVKAPIMNVKWSIDSDSDEVREFCQKNLQKIWGNFIRDVLNAINFGFQAFEKVWVKKDGKWHLDEFLDLYPPSVTIKKDKDNYKFAGLQQYTAKKGKIDIPVEKSFVFTIDKRFGNLYGRSRLRSAYMYWYIDKYTYDFENIYFERFAQPLIVGEAPSGYTQTAGGTSSPSLSENLNLLLPKLKALRTAGAIVLPSDTDPVSKQKKWAIKFLESQKQGAQFEARHRQLDQMKARAIFAPELVFSSPYAGASYALAREHATIFIGAEEAILQDIKTHIDKYILRDLVRYNFGQKASAEWNYESISTETKNLVRDLVIAMVQGEQIKPDADWLARTMNLKLRETAKETEEAIKEETEEEKREREEREEREERGAEKGRKEAEKAKIKEEEARRETEKLLKRALAPRIRPPAVSPVAPAFRSPRAYERAGARPKAKVRRVGPRMGRR